jgi:hypothetical protein
MSYSSPTFPVLYVSASALLLLFGLWLVLRRSRKRTGTEPRCHQCDYILIGILSQRCPECGTTIDHDRLPRGQRRARTLRVAAGLVLLATAPAISWRPMAAWSGSFYWYQYRPSFLVMRDLERGSGLPPPANNPLTPQYMYTHGWLRERVDLARVALDELLRRDKAGKLSADDRHQIEEMEIANLSTSFTNPVQWYLNEDFSDRLAAGTLSPDERAKFISHAINLDLLADPIVMQWDDVPIQIRSKASLPNSGWDIAVTFVSASIDGKDVSWWHTPRSNPTLVEYFSDGTRFARQSFPYSMLGRHQLDLTIQIEIRHLGNSSPAKGVTIHSEVRTISTTFTEIQPTLTMKILRFTIDPQHEAGHYFSERSLLNAIRIPVPYLTDLAITEMIRRSRIDELSNYTNTFLIEQILCIQKDRSQIWVPSYGDYVEQQRALKKVSDAQWKRYGSHQLGFCVRTRSPIREGDPLPLNLVTLARRGNSQVDIFPASRWSLRVDFSPDVPPPVRLGYWDGIDVMILTDFPNDPVNPYYVTRYVVSIPNTRRGLHTVRTHLSLNDMTYIKRSQQLEIPSAYDLGSTAFTVVPPTRNTITPVSDPELIKRIQQCIEISDLIRQRDSLLMVTVNMHRPPIDVAFHVSILAGTRQWTVGDIFTAKGTETDSAYTSFNVKDTKWMPSDGLTFKFTADPEIARELVGSSSCWNKDIVIGGISMIDDAFLKPKPWDRN